MTTVKSPRTPARLAVLPLVLALGACAFAPTASRPRAPQPAVRRAAPAAAAPAQGVAQRYEQGAQPVPQWWKARLARAGCAGRGRPGENPDLAATGRSLAAPASSCAARSIHP